MGHDPAILEPSTAALDLTDRSRFFQHLETNRRQEATKETFARPKYIRDEIRIKKRILLAVILGKVPPRRPLPGPSTVHQGRDQDKEEDPTGCYSQVPISLLGNNSSTLSILKEQCHEMKLAV